MEGVIKMRRNDTLYVVIESDTERQIDGWGRNKWGTTINPLEVYSSMADADMAAKRWQRNRDEDRNNGCSPDNMRRYYVETVIFIK